MHLRPLSIRALLLTMAFSALHLHCARARATEAEDGPVLNEIVVTATRREQMLNDVPIAVTAISGSQVTSEHIVNFDDLPKHVPGINFISVKGNSTADLAIRGQFTLNDAPALEVPVGIFIDDIYYGTLASFDASFFDVQQIAVLKGPQGTTFGRNVVGGALQITSNRPKLGVTSGEINATIQSYDISDSLGGDVNGYFNLPVGDRGAVRLAYSVRDDAGYMHNETTGNNLNNQNNFALRPSFRYDFSSDLSVTGFVNYYHEHQYADGYHDFGQGARVASYNAISSGPWDVFQDIDGESRRDIDAAQVRVDWTQSYGTLTSITSYRSLHASEMDDGDATPEVLNYPSVNSNKEHAFTQEFRIVSPSGQKFEYVAGLYYTYEDLEKSISYGFNGTIFASFISVLTKGVLQHQTVSQDDHTSSPAAYAEGTYHFTDKLSLIVGGRYTDEIKDGYTNHIGTSAFYGPTFYANWDHSWSAFTPRGILEYKPMQDVMFYGSISTGFKGGGFSIVSTSVAAAQTPLKPEHSISYEVGTKGEYWQRRLTFNLDVYQAVTKDVQVRSLIGPTITDTNAGEQRVRGVELDSLLIPFSHAQIGLSYAYTDAIYTSFPGCAAGLSCTGHEVPYVPKNSVQAFAQYSFETGTRGTLDARVSDRWASSTQLSALANTPLAIANTEVRGVLDASLTYRPTGASWKTQLWAKNLTNTWYESTPTNYYFYFLTPQEYAAGLRQTYRGIVNPPRQFGLTFSYNF
jgi:iron complex outermembrane recepter protein